MILLVLRGKVFKYGKNVDTDVIIPARYLNTTDPQELARHCLEDLDGDFARRVQPGDIIVAEENFGCGSSREHAPLAIKACGVSCVIAKSFARIFFRNAINTGLPILESPEAVDSIQAGDEVEVDLERGSITDLTTGISFAVIPYPEFMRRIVEVGGYVNFVKENLSRRR